MSDQPHPSVNPELAVSEANLKTKPSPEEDSSSDSFEQSKPERALELDAESLLSADGHPGEQPDFLSTLAVESSAPESQSPALPYPVVGFGGSAGDLRAFHEILELELQRAADRIVLARFGPPGLVVDEHLNVLQSRGQTVLLLDIDQLRRSQQHLIDARDFASSVVESVPVPVVVLNKDCSIRTVNTAFRDLIELPPKELEGRSFPELAQFRWGIGDLQHRLEGLLASPQTHLEFEHESSTAKKKNLLIKGQVLNNKGDRVLLLMLEDITLRREAEQLIAAQQATLEGEVEPAGQALSRTRGELGGLSSLLFTAQEQDREHVARELHDDISQRLSLLELMLHEIRLEGSSAAEVAKLQAARNQLQAITTDVRQISHRLHPSILKDLGLSAALRSLLEEFGRLENMPVNFSSSNVPEVIPDKPCISLYRICQEALRNVAKHAGRTHVKVVLEGTNERLQLRIMDFGIGFDQQFEHPPEGLGMVSMQERARIAGGAFEVHSALGAGTTISVTVPIEQDGK